MSIRDGLEPSRSPDSDTHTQPIPRDEAAPDNPAGASSGPRLQPDEAPAPGPGQSDHPTTPADQAWPPSWGQSPSSWEQAPAPADSPTWTQPTAAQGPSWTQQAGNDAADAPGTGPTAADADGQPAAPGAGPSWGQGGGGGYPTTPAWGARPADAGSPSGRRPSRWLAGAVAGVVLLAAGYGISEAIDRDPAPAGAGIPTASPVSVTPVPSGEEPAAAVAKTLLPTVVEIRRGSDGLGSGFVYDSNGYIMTAAHVIEGVDEVEIRLYDGTRLRGEVLGTDELNDVGVVKVDRTGLKAAPLAVGQTVQVGQLAIAIGSPFGLNETVTAGIVSSNDRVLPDGREVIQTDAPINPGNSGGVLADRRGRVIGINSAIRPGGNSNGNVGIGFAVPIDIAAKSAAAIVRGEEIQIGYLGVSMGDATGNQSGAVVQEVTPDSPAAQAGLQAGDVVVSIDGKAVQDRSELVAAIRGHKPGDKVTLGVVRAGNETTSTATLTQRPAG
jgi:putative serine protease PepD